MKFQPVPASPKSRMPGRGWRGRREENDAKTKLGKWAGGLSAVFVVLLIVVINERNWLGLKIGDPRLIMLGTCMMISGIAAFVTGTVSLIKFKDRSAVVILAVVFGFIAVLIIIMEVVEAIVERSAQ
jgi:hypothetical protein